MNRPTLALLAAIGGGTLGCTPAGQVDNAKIDLALVAIQSGWQCVKTGQGVIETVGNTGKQSVVDRVTAVIQGGGKLLVDADCRAALSADAALLATVKL